MNSRGNKAISRILTICSLVIGLFFAGYFLYPVFASPPTTPYAPGETLNPNCAPGDPNCTVYAPLTTTLTTSTAISIGTSTLNFGNGLILLDGTARTLTLASTTLGNATSTNFFSTGLNFTNASGASVTSTNGYFTTLGSGTFTPTNINAANVTSTNLYISGLTNLGGLTLTNGTSTNFNVGTLLSFASANGASVTSTNIYSGNYSGSGTFTNVTSTNLALNSFTNGSILFTTSSGQVSQTSGLFWNNVDGRLGVGTTTPATALQVTSPNSTQLRLGYSSSL